MQTDKQTDTDRQTYKREPIMQTKYLPHFPYRSNQYSCQASSYKTV